MFGLGQEAVTGCCSRHPPKTVRVFPGYLLDGEQQNPFAAKIEDLELAQQFQQLAKLPAEDKLILKSVVDAFLFKRHVQSLSKTS